MDTENEELAPLCVLLDEEENAKKKRTSSVRHIYKERNLLGTFENPVRELSHNDREYYFKEHSKMATNLKVENQNLAAETLQKIQWSEESLPLSEFVTKYPLPQIVQVEEGFHGGSDENSLSTGQVLKVHTLTTERKLLCLDRHEKELYIPLHSIHKVILKPENHEHVYQRVSDLSRARPLPSFVEVTRGYYNVDSNVDYELSVEPGEVLEVVCNESSLNRLTKRNRAMTFRNSENVEIKIPYDCVAGFKPLLDNEEHNLSDVIPTDTNHYTFPFYFEFISPIDADTKLGTIKCMSCYDDKLIITSCGQGKGQVVFMIPQNLDITVKVAVGTITDDPAYENIRRSYHNFKSLETDLQKSRNNEGLVYKRSNASEIVGIAIPSNDGRRSSNDFLHPGWETFDDNAYDVPLSNESPKPTPLINGIHSQLVVNGVNQMNGFKNHSLVKNAITQTDPQPSIAHEDACTQVETAHEDAHTQVDEEDITNQVPSMSVEKLCECLRSLNMEKYVEVFIENQIDGALFCELDENELSDLGLNKFEIKKLFTFKKGWRPKLK